MGAGVLTRFDILDDVGLRWQPGKVTAVLARPGAGKTQFMLEACARILEADPESHAVFLSWEEPLADVVERLIQRADARRTCVDGARPQPLPREVIRAFGRGESIPQALKVRIGAALDDVTPLLDRLRLVDGDEVGRDVHRTLAEVGAWMREPESPRVALVAVDYFQKLQGPDDAHSRLHELQGVSDTLRRFAKGARLNGEDLNAADEINRVFAVPVLVGAQVNRASAQSTSETGHPTGDTIREGDDLLNDASAVIALSWVDAPGDGTEAVRWLRVSIPKHRGGRTRGTFGDEVACIEWRPARMWLKDRCFRLATGAVAWQPPGAVAGQLPEKASGPGLGSEKPTPGTADRGEFDLPRPSRGKLKRARRGTSEDHSSAESPDE